MASVLIASRFLVTRFFPIPDIALLAGSIVIGILTYFVTLKAAKMADIDEMVRLVKGIVGPYFKVVFVKLKFRYAKATNDVGQSSTKNRRM